MLAPALVSMFLTAAFTPSFSQRTTSPSGDLRLGLGTLSEPLPGEVRAAARAFALAHRSELGLPGTSTLSPAEAFGTWFGASFRMNQRLDGVDLYGAEVVVTLDRSRRVVQVSSSLEPYQQSVLDWRMTPDQALALAAREVPLAWRQPGGAPYGGVRRQLFAVGGEVHSGYFTYVPSVDITQNWFVAVDATDGQVLWKQNRVFHSEAAQVYASSPGGLDAGVGVTPLLQVELTHLDGGSMLLANDGGHLIGDLLVAYGCCPNKGCETGPDAGPKRADGGMDYGGFTVNFDVPECDRVQRATNDPALNPDGSFVYPPQDPPALLPGNIPGPVIQSDPADSDPFAEVHGFYQVNRVYDWVKTLSATAAPLFPGNTPAIEPFKTRDAKLSPPKKMAVWSNVTTPDYEDMKRNFNLATMSARTDKLARVDNAAYMAKENFPQLVLPDYMLDVDTLVIFQADRADFSYDAPVLWHEFGHGVVYGSANFDSFALDERSANNEGGALHEGFADFFAAAFGQNPRMGEYVGPRMATGGGGAQLTQEVPLRDLEATDACPQVLWGEVHQDSQHFSQALWQARKTLFQGADQGHTFDAAVYAALVSMVHTTNFTQAAAILSAHMTAAFPGIAQADTKMAAVFDQRAVTHCSKVLDMTAVTAARTMYAIGGPGSVKVTAASLVPGPYQMKFSLPHGAKSVTISAQVQDSVFGPAQTKARLLAKGGEPITFTRTGNALTNNADVTANAAVAGTTLSAQAVIAVPCGTDVYFTIATTTSGGETLEDLTAAFVPADTCPVPDAGVDAGAGESDAGAIVLTAIPEEGKAGAGAVPAGCGCGSADAGLSVFGLALLASLARLRRRGARRA